MRESERDQPTTERARKLKGFFIHLTVFGLINVGLFLLNIIRNPDRLWFYWVFIGWGAGVLLHAGKVFTGKARQVWNERKNTKRQRAANPARKHPS